MCYQEMKKKRNDVTVEIRKNKRDETLQKKRNVPNTEDTTGIPHPPLTKYCHNGINFVISLCPLIKIIF